MAKKNGKSLPVASNMAEKISPAIDKGHWHEAEERRYRAEDGLRVLQRAEECRKDKQLMADIKRLAKSQMKVLGKI